MQKNLTNLKQSLLFILFLLNIFVSYGLAQTDSKVIKLGYLVPKKSETSKTEIKASLQYLNSTKNVSVEIITFSKISKRPEILNRFDVLWFHKPDDSDFTVLEQSKEVRAAIYNYLQRGGGLLLSQDAFKYINVLDIERKIPEVRQKSAQDNGYGLMLGFHGFREHPVFTGLNGGSYILKPKQDKTVRLLGYFDDNVPNNGKVVAVDWDYIFVRESSKIVLEYQIGKGKVLAVGGYMLFSEDNVNRLHLEEFTLNSLLYLTGKLNTKTHYWEYRQNKVLPFSYQAQNSPLAKAEKLAIGSKNEVLSRRLATDNYWDVAGERMLIMGYEKGGISELWAHPFMALRDYELGIKFSNKDTIYWLNNEKPQIEVRPESFTRKYNFNQAGLTETIIADPSEADMVCHYEYKGDYPARIIVRFKSNLRLMWPYSSKVLNTINYNWNENMNSFIIKDKNGDFVTLLGSNKKPIQALIGQFKDFELENNNIYKGVPGNGFTVSALCQFNLKKLDNFDICISASSEGLEKTINSYKKVVEKPMNINKRAYENVQEFFNSSTIITSPDEVFNTGYCWALTATDRFFVNTPDIGTSLVAGYSTTDKGWDGGHKVNGRPGYGWYFGRDAVWSAFAILDYGDFAGVKKVLETFIKYQDLNGKIFHELSTSGFVHYDASDASPLFVVLAGKYLKHSGDISFIKMNWPAIKKAIDFCYSTDTDGDNLIENTNVGHGWVEGGGLFGSHSSLYLTATWAAALNEAGYMANHLNLSEQERLYKKDSRTVIKILNKDFWNTDNDFFFQGKFKDGNYHREQTILPTVPMYFNLIDNEKADKVLKHFSENKYSTDWGTRIVSYDSELYKPQGYHTGSVWPLFTGWTALAEYQYNKNFQAFTHLMNNLNVYQNWGLGFVEEVLNGIEYKPSGVCSHQCWSETMVLQPVLEGMLGFKPDAMNNTLHLKPDLPAHWDSLEVKNIHIGDDYLSVKMLRVSDKYVYKFEKRNNGTFKVLFNPVFPAGTDINYVNVNGKRVKFSAESHSQGEILPLVVDVKKETLVEIGYDNGIAVIPSISNPKPGDKTSGFRILSSNLQDKQFSIDFQGQSDNREFFEVYINDYQLKRAENAKLISKNGNIYRFELEFEPSKLLYVFAEVKLYLE